MGRATLRVGERLANKAADSRGQAHRPSHRSASATLAKRPDLHPLQIPGEAPLHRALLMFRPPIHPSQSLPFGCRQKVHRSFERSRAARPFCGIAQTACVPGRRENRNAASRSCVDLPINHSDNGTNRPFLDPPRLFHVELVSTASLKPPAWLARPAVISRCYVRSASCPSPSVRSKIDTCDVHLS